MNALIDGISVCLRRKSLGRKSLTTLILEGIAPAFHHAMPLPRCLTIIICKVAPSSLPPQRKSVCHLLYVETFPQCLSLQLTMKTSRNSSDSAILVWTTPPKPSISMAPVDFLDSNELRSSVKRKCGASPDLRSRHVKFLRSPIPKEPMDDFVNRTKNEDGKLGVLLDLPYLGDMKARCELDQELPLSPCYKGLTVQPSSKSTGY